MPGAHDGDKTRAPPPQPSCGYVTWLPDRNLDEARREHRIGASAGRQHAGARRGHPVCCHLELRALFQCLVNQRVEHRVACRRCGEGRAVALFLRAQCGRKEREADE